MISVTNTQNSIALQLLQSTSHSSANSSASARHSDPASIIGAISSGSDATNSPVTKALAEITRISLENGGEAISAGDDAKVTGTDFDDYIQVGRGSTVNAGDGDDTIVAGWGSTVNGGEGNDYIVAHGSIASGSVVHGGDGDDTINAGGEIYGGTGDDRITGAGNLVGGEGNDGITVRGTRDGNTSTVNGGAGDDRISFQGASGTVEGGAGNDRISVFNSRVDADGVATVKFNEGDGEDFIQVSNSDVVVKLGEGFSAENMKVSYSEDGKQAFVTFNGNEDDQLILSNTDYIEGEAPSTVTIQFADGSKQNIELKNKFSS